MVMAGKYRPHCDKRHSSTIRSDRRTCHRLRRRAFAPVDREERRTLMPSSVVVTAPARLHLGFLDMHGGLGRRFGSLGLTIEGFATRVRVEPATETVVQDIHCVTRWSRFDAEFVTNTCRHRVSQLPRTPIRNVDAVLSRLLNPVLDCTSICVDSVMIALRTFGSSLCGSPLSF